MATSHAAKNGVAAVTIKLSLSLLEKLLPYPPARETSQKTEWPVSTSLVGICSRSSRRSKTEETKHLFEGGKSRTNITGKVTKNADSTSFLQITL